MARTRRLGYGEGSVYKELDPDTGALVRWRGEITIDAKRYRPSGDSRGEVVAKLDELRLAAAGGEPPGTDTTVGAWLAWWSARVSAAKDPITHKHDRNCVALLSGLSGKRLRELRRVDVQQCLTALATREKRPLNRASIHKVKSVLGQAIDEAIEHHPELGITRNVARGKWTPPEAAPPKDLRRMTPDEARALMEAVKDTDLEAMVLLMLHMPLRPGEVAALRWGAVDLKAGTVAIRANRREMPDGTTVQGEVKALNERTGRVPPVVLAALKRHQRAQRRARQAASVWSAPGDFVFCDEIGGQLADHILYWQFGRACERAGIGWFPPYAARAAAISFLVDSGVPLQAVADLAGNTLEVMSRNYRYRVAGVIDVTEAQARMLKAPRA
jgi:integrase